jgi:hypothetical protein
MKKLFFEFNIPHGINSEEDSNDVDNHDVAVYIDEDTPCPIYPGSSHTLGECYLNALFDHCLSFSLQF